MNLTKEELELINAVLSRTIWEYEQILLNDDEYNRIVKPMIELSQKIIRETSKR